MKIKAILGGYGIVILINILLMLLNVVFFGLINSGLSSDEDPSFRYTILQYFYQGIHFLSYLLGGFIAAKIARKNEILHGITLGITVWLLANLLSFIIRRGSEPLTFEPAILWSLLICMSGCAAGSFIQRKFQEKIKKENEDAPLEEKIRNLGNHEQA